MLLANLVAAACFQIVAFNAISAVPHIRERHVIKVPLKFKIIHHHKIQEVPIIIRKHVHYYKEKEQPIIEDTHSNHIFHDVSHDHFGDSDFPKQINHQEFQSSDVSYDHHNEDDIHDDDYDEQSQEEEYEDDEYE